MVKLRDLEAFQDKVFLRKNVKAASLGLLSCLGLVNACSREPAPEPPLEIHVAEVIQRDQPIFVELIGETRGSFDIPIRARVEGVLLGMHFVEGFQVEEGQLLYSIDPLPYETGVVEAEGLLAETVTRLAKNESDLERIRPLVQIGAASEQDLSGAIAQYEAAVGARNAAAARLERAKIELGYTKIKAPISGRIGITAAKVGEFVGRAPNPVVLNSVSVVDPIRVRFALDERNYIRLARDRIIEPESEEDEASYRFELILADGSIHSHRGRLIAMDAEMDPDTGTFALEAEFPNPQKFILSGQFARVRVAIDNRPDAILVPQRAIRDVQGIFLVYVVNDQGHVNAREVMPGARVDRLQIIEQGLTSAERIALQIARLEDGMLIEPILTRLGADGTIETPEQ